MTTLLSPTTQHNKKRIFVMLAVALVAWLIAYNLIQPLANWISYSAFGLASDSCLGESVAFFLYDMPKILLLLSGMVFLIAIVRTFSAPRELVLCLVESVKALAISSLPCSELLPHFAHVLQCHFSLASWNPESPWE